LHGALRCLSIPGRRGDVVVGLYVAGQGTEHNALEFAQVREPMIFVSVIPNLIDEILDSGIPFYLVVPSNTDQDRHILVPGEMIFVMGSGETFGPFPIFRPDDHKIDLAFREVVQVTLWSGSEHTGLVFVQNRNTVFIEKRVGRDKCLDRPPFLSQLLLYGTYEYPQLDHGFIAALLIAPAGIS